VAGGANSASQLFNMALQGQQQNIGQQQLLSSSEDSMFASCCWADILLLSLQRHVEQLTGAVRTAGHCVIRGRGQALFCVFLQVGLALP